MYLIGENAQHTMLNVFIAISLVILKRYVIRKNLMSERQIHKTGNQDNNLITGQVIDTKNKGKRDNTKTEISKTEKKHIKMKI